MSPEELAELLDGMRRIGGEFDDVEAKAAQGGLPHSAIDSVVSFANTRGGVILLGVDEENGFTPVGASDPAAFRTALTSQAESALEPPQLISVEFVELSGKQIVVVSVPEAPSEQKPVYFKTKGPLNGALVRSGEGDRRMTPAEVGILYASRAQPRWDVSPVVESSRAELAAGPLSRSLERLRSSVPSFRAERDDVILRRMKILVPSSPGSEELVPSLGGLLTFGDFPQEHFPQLMVTFTAHLDADGGRFSDNVTIRGSIPSMTAEVVAAVRRNLSVATRISEWGRAEELDYSLEAVRELVVNALLHRDYSETTRGAQVQVQLFRDRLVVTSPGGLYGPIAEEELGRDGLSTSRNAMLASLLSDAYMPGSDTLVAENRASGIPTVIREARRHGQGRPKFASTITSFTVTMLRSELLGDDTRGWLTEIGGPWPSGAHEIALAMMRQDSVTNEALREWGIDRIEAGRVLKDLVTAGVAVKEGGRRYARYVLSSAAANPAPPAPAESVPAARGAVDASASPTTPPEAPPLGRRVVDLLQQEGPQRMSDLVARLGASRPTLLKTLGALMEKDEIVANGSLRSPQRRYASKS